MMKKVAGELDTKNNSPSFAIRVFQHVSCIALDSYSLWELFSTVCIIFRIIEALKSVGDQTCWTFAPQDQRARAAVSYQRTDEGLQEGVADLHRPTGCPEAGGQTGRGAPVCKLTQTHQGITNMFYAVQHALS